MASIKDKIYQNAPLFIKEILMNLIAKKNSNKRYTDDYYKYLEEYNDLWFADREGVLQYQKKQLTKLLKECKAYAPYYQREEWLKNVKVEEIENDPYKVLYSLPLLSKEDRKEKVEGIINTNPDRPVVEIGFTSGTSGSPTVNHMGEECITRAFALWGRFHDTIDVKKTDRNVRFSGRLVVKPTRKKPPFWVLNRLDNQLFMSTYHLKTEYLSDYIKKLNEFQPLFLDGYPSAFYILARFINNQGIPLNFRPKAIAVTAETLMDYQREEIEKAFGCKVYNQYASSEGSPFITECKEGKLHINEDSGIFEFLNAQDQPAKPGEVARLVVTSFRNWKTPLLRYDIQDTVLLAEEQKPCACGCQMHYVEKIVGREDDLLWTQEKGYVGRMDTAYKGLDGIGKSQIIQKSPTLVVVKQTVDDKYTPKMEALLIQNLKDRLGESIKVEIHIVEDIPLGSNGKFDAVQREFEIPE